MNNELKALAYLLIYPDHVLIENLEKIKSVLSHSTRLSKSEGETLKNFIQMLTSSPLTEIQSLYVSTFENNRNRCLNLFEHLEGESKDRGASMVHLIKLYGDYGLEFSSHELPDFLPAVLEFLSGLNNTDTEIWLSSIAPLIAILDSELMVIKNPWSAVTGALLTLAKQKRIQKQMSPEKKADDAPIRFISSAF